MDVLGIAGSPHPEGNTVRTLRRTLEQIAGEGFETELISLAGKEIHPCRGDFHCRDGRCIQDDDMSQVYDALRTCRGLILASPVYMGLVTGQMKNMMDRTVVFRSGDSFELSGKVGGGIACGGFRNGGQELTLQCMHTYFLQQDMYVVADGPPYSHSGAAVTGRAGADETGLKTADNLARRMVRALGELG